MLPGLRAEASEIANAHVARAEVADDSREARTAALGAALDQVVLRLTGREVPAESLASMRAAVADLVSAYRFLWREGAPGDTPQRLIEVRFDPAALERRLAELGIPVWGLTRPDVLVWIGVETGGGRRWFDRELDVEATAVIEAAADARGVPLIWPLNDVEDRASLALADLWGGFAEPIGNASTRYAPNAILSVRIERDGARFRTRWTLLQGDNPAVWDHAGYDLGALLTQGIATTAETLAARFAPLASSLTVENAEIEFDGVKSLDDFAAINTLVESLAGVRAFRPVYADGERLRYAVEFTGGRNALEQTLKLQRRLQVQAPVVDTASPGTETAPSRLYFRYQR